jgi:LPPG:FO 2-phospho-L-lactate transferase
MMSELGLPVSAVAVARRYADLLDAYVLDHADAADAGGLGIPTTAAPTLMLTLDDREALAREVLATAANACSKGYERRKREATPPS